MENILNVLMTVLVLQIWVLWYQYFYEESFYNTLADISFYFRVFSGCVCFFCLGQRSVITEQDINTGEITRQVFIGD